MADPLSNPLGAITQAFEGYFSPEYLAFMLIIGYFIFFLFFYGTEKWKTIDWTERFFFGFILGIISSTISRFLYYPFAFPLATLHLDFWISYLVYLLPIGFIFVLVLLRALLKMPLASPLFHKKLSSFFNQDRAYWPIILMVCSLMIVLGFQFNNTPMENPSAWTEYLIILNFFVPMFTILIITLISLISSFSEPIDEFLSTFVKVLRWYFFSFNKRKPSMVTNEPFLKKIEKFKYFLVNSFDDVKNVRINYHFITVLVSLLLIIGLFIAADNTFQILTPSVQIIDTQTPELGTHYVDFYRCYNGTIVYLSDTSQIYWIKLPFFNLRYFNVSIANPSNFSGDMQYINSRYRSLSLSVTANDSFAYTLVKESGQLRYIDILPLNNSLQEKSPVNFTISYYDLIELDAVKVGDPSTTILVNGSTTITAKITINNDNNFTLHTSGIPLYRKSDFDNLGNVTSYTWIVNQNIASNPIESLDIFGDSVFTPDIYILPHESMNFISAVTFGVDNQ